MNKKEKDDLKLFLLIGGIILGLLIALTIFDRWDESKTIISNKNIVNQEVCKNVERIELSSEVEETEINGIIYVCKGGLKLNKESKLCEMKIEDLNIIHQEVCGQVSEKCKEVLVDLKTNKPINISRPGGCGNCDFKTICQLRYEKNE